MVSVPHGGKLVNKVLLEDEVKEIKSNLRYYKSLNISRDLVMDVEQIAIGGFSPLGGFLNEEDYNSVLKDKRLKNGIIWPIPITLVIDKFYADKFKESDEIILKDFNDKAISLLKIENKYYRNKEYEAKKVFGTNDINHPGVLDIYKTGKIILGGEVFLLQRPDSKLKNYELTPEETRKIFHNKNWDTIVGFHTRNVPHRAHEYLQKTALENLDGLFIHPVIGRKKSGDFKSELILKTYEELINKFYPKDKL